MEITYQNQAAVQTATDACLAQNMRVLQLYQCGDETAHVDRLLDMMAPPENACIVDVGCGIGEVARLMVARRPDLGFLLLNLSEYQLALCPQEFTRIRADMHDMPVNDACADVVMVNYTLGYADLGIFLKEAYRVLKPGGILFIYDLSHNELLSIEPCDLMERKFGYRVFSRHFINSAAVRGGFVFDRIQFPPATRVHLDPLVDNEYRAVLAELDSMTRPTAWRFIKEVA
jgi:ubiquinone/menaquinone biosynthesis C-methylase UbiE